MTALEREYVLPAYGELRIVTATTPGHATKVLLHRQADGESGDQSAPRAEIFGAEMIPGVAVQLPVSRSLSVFTPTGCTLTVAAPPSVLQRCYATTSGNVWMRSLIDIHSHLEVQRCEAKAGGGIGPRVLFVSDRRHAGTSTYVRMLAHNAVRLGYHPLLVDAAVDHPQLGYHSCLSLYHLQHTLDIEEAATFLPGVHVLSGTPRNENTELYVHGIRQVVSLSLEKMARSDRCRVGGLFLDYGVVSCEEIEEAEQRQQAASVAENPSSSPSENPLDVLLDTIVEADVDHVFVVQSAWLRFKIVQRAQERFSSAAAKEPLLMVPSEVMCDSGLRFKLYQVDSVDYVNTFPTAMIQRQKWLQYFFGSATSPVKPTLLQLDTATVRIASIGASKQSALSTLMPMLDEDGDVSPAEKSDPAAVTFLTTQDVDLTGRIMGISTATEMEMLPDGAVHRLPYIEVERRIKQCIITGFALVESVTPDRITLLVNDAPLRKDLGLCLLLTPDILSTK